MRLALVFPGQGAQAAGLGAPWIGLPAWSAAERIDAALDGAARHFLLDAGPGDLVATDAAQLCVLSASLVAYEAVARALPPPVAVAGHSLGQITALIVSGAVEFEAGLALAAQRAACTRAATETVAGRMVALLGATVDIAEAACSAAPGAAWIANDNAPGQIVIGGTPDGVAAASAAARDLGVRKVSELAVAGAFHTPLMAAAADAFADGLASISFSPPVTPVVGNTDAREHADAGWAPRLVEHLVRPVRWRESLERLAQLGVDTIVEVGPGGVLAGTVKRTLPGVATHVVAGPADADRFVAALMLEGVRA